MEKVDNKGEPVFTCVFQSFLCLGLLRTRECAFVKKYLYSGENSAITE